MTHNDTHASWIVECTFCTNMLYSFPKQVSEWEHSALVSAYLCRNAACMRFCFVYFILPPCTLSIFIPYRLSAHDRQKREKQFVIISPMGYVAKIKVTTPTERWKSSFMCCFFCVPFELEKQRKITKHKWWRQWMCGIKCHVGSDSQSKWKHTMPLPLQMKIEKRKNKYVKPITKCVHADPPSWFILNLYITFHILSGRSIATGETSCFPNRSWSGMQS